MLTFEDLLQVRVVKQGEESRHSAIPVNFHRVQIHGASEVV